MPHSVQLIPISYSHDSANWFVQLRHLKNPVWLDSGRPLSQYGRFDILCAAPAITLKTLSESTYIDNGEHIEVSNENPFDLIKQFLPLNISRVPEVPFCGGALGYFGYDLGRHLEKLPTLAAQDIAIPDMNIGIYPWAIVQDHELKRAWLVINPSLAPAYNFLEIRAICTEDHQSIGFHDLKSNLINHNNPFKINNFSNNLKVGEYLSAVDRIQDYIGAGDCYQVNFAQRFSAHYSGDPFEAYLILRETLPSPFSGYLEFAEGCLLSFSPERFIKLNDQLAETKPIKGTIARGTSVQEDEENAMKLKSSLKDRAENLMIVDLLRNDLSKTCTHINVPELFTLQSFANVHHLVSTVTGQLMPNKNAVDLLSNSFPGGSITGAPKIRAMEIIEELEPVRRSAYCGSIGYISACGTMDTNITIRTLVCSENTIYCWGGGGIVADSEAEKEYEESVTKVKVLLTTLEKHFANA